MPEKNSYDYILFNVLVYEYDVSLKAESERKIKQRLKYHKKGVYDQKRVDYIRALCKDLSSEIRLMNKSRYYKKTEKAYADMDDFNVAGMGKDFLKKYDKIKPDDMHSMIAFQIYYSYLH